MQYADINKTKKAFLFELDNVLFPEKDYLYQVYYLFASLLEYTHHADAKTTTDVLVNACAAKGSNQVFDELKKATAIDEKYRAKLAEMMINAKLPLRLLLYKDMLTLLQDIVIDRKQLFIVTNGNPFMQLNKIKQTEWHGLEKYLKVYFADELRPMPETDVIELILKDHDLQRKDLFMIGSTPECSLCAANCGIDFMGPELILQG